MSGSQEIRTQIASIQNTQKITKAMEMVAASKMKKAQDQMTKARPYADKILNVIKHLPGIGKNLQDHIDFNFCFTTSDKNTFRNISWRIS